MLVLRRSEGQAIVIANNIEIRVLKTTRHQVKLGINAPKDVAVHREELLENLMEEQKFEIVLPRQLAKEVER